MRTATVGEDSPSVVLLTQTPAAGTAFRKRPRFVGQKKSTPLQVFLFFICCFTAIVLTVVNPIFMFSSPFSLQWEQNTLLN